jgi:thiamine-monophosphate kinase
VSDEAAFIALMRDLATSGAARALMDDAAVLDVAAWGGGDTHMVLTSDTIVEGVHFLPDDPPADIAWKLAAVNLSDLAAKGAKPVGCLMNYSLSGDARWDTAFAQGLGQVLGKYAMPLLGGDTVRMPTGAPRSFTLTAMGSAAGPVPARAGAKPGDALYLTGTVGAAGAGLKLCRAGKSEPAALVAAYRRPQPRVREGRALAPLVHAMMDVSDGLLIDASRMAMASRVAIIIDHVPVADALRAWSGDDSIAARLSAACAGDDYELLLALPAGCFPPADLPLMRVGEVRAGSGLSVALDGENVPLPDRLGYLHGD